MKKMNNKGFIMVETLIVTVFVVSLFIFIYQMTVPLMGEYEKIYYFDDIDSIYASNLYKQMLTRYANMNYINDQLNSSTYVDISDCDNANIYYNKDYCKLIKDYLHITDNDYVFITDYNISNFKNQVRIDEKFDSGNLSSFRSYINTVKNIETFYKNSNIENYAGKYRLFITRTINEADSSNGRRYVNVGVYTGVHERFNQGEKVYFNPETDTLDNRYQEWYVLKNSPTTESTVTLIATENDVNRTRICFNDTDGELVDTSVKPQEVLDLLYDYTKGWSKANDITSKYVSKEGYTIDYGKDKVVNGISTPFKARLLDENDIIEILGCKNDTTCFDPDEAFMVDALSNTQMSFLLDNLRETRTNESEPSYSGYWTAVTVFNSNLYAWSIQKNGIAPVKINYCKETNGTQIGIRPVIEVEKSKVDKVSRK